jgi:hypothetical protein
MPLNKQQLEVVNQTNFPNNNGQLITPALLRDFNSDIIEAIQLTGSYATTGANTFVGNQIITGNLSVSGVISASVLYVQTETASVIYSSGSNQLGDELSDTQTLSGSVKVQGSLTVNGVPVLTGSVSVDTGSLVTTASFNAYTASNNQRVSSLETNSASVNISITNVNSATASLFTSVNSLNSFTASQLILNGQYATTGSNTFTGNQIIDRASKLYTNGIYWTDVTAGYNNLEIINQGGGNLDLASLNNGKIRFVSSSVNFLNSPISSSNDISTSANIYAANLTGSTLPSGVISSSAQITSLGFVSSSVTASSLVTASFDNGTRNLTFTKGDASTFNVNIPDVSGSTLPSGLLSSSVTNFTDYSASVDSRINSITGSTIDTGSFATTGSNTFVGNQIINADLTVSGSTNVGFVNVADAGGINLETTGSGSTTSYGIVTNPSNGDLVFNTNPGNGRLMTFNQTDGIMNLWNGMKLDTSFIGIDVYDHPLNLSSSFGGMTTMLTAQGNVVVSGSMIASGSSIVTGSMNITGSISTIGSASVIGSLTALSKTTIELGADNGIKIGATNGSGAGIDVGNISMQVRQGSLSLAPTLFSNTTASLSHLSSSSSNSFVNLIFKSNNNTGDTIISGSNNVFVNPPNPTAGFKRYVGGFGNNLGIVPQITGSYGFSPNMSNSWIATGMLMRIPVSSSAYTMAGNVLNNPTANGVQLGTSATLNFEKAVSGLTFNNNNINGTLGATAYKTPLSSSVTIVSNNIGGNVGLNMDSSSISFVNNIVQGLLNVNNSYFPSTYTAPNAILAVSNFINVGGNIIYASGSNATFPSNRNVFASSMLGNQNVMSASLNGNSAQIQSTHLIGFGLNVLGTNLIQTSSVNDFGSVFIGRNNAIDGNKNKTAETVFAVGTGDSTTRKTGFLIDSGSNTYVEGSLNVSGSTSLTGSLYIQSGSWIPSATGSSLLTWNEATGRVAQSPLAAVLANTFSLGVFTSTITQSGSAAVSQSMTFNNTEESSGVTLSNDSRLNVATSGYYNIQFSAQLLADTGADDVWIWLKKNGTNVPNTNTRITLANNEEIVAAWNFVVNATSGDYYELVWQSADGHTNLLTEPASGNYPVIPSVVVTVTQVR